MPYVIEPVTLLTVAVAMIIGVLIGLALRSGLKRRSAVLAERVSGLTRERDLAFVERDRLTTDL